MVAGNPASKSNQTFRVGAPTWANACVGDNGNPQIFEYAAGFASAAKSLLDTVIHDAGMELSVDPICFNMRHALELFLKSTVASLTQLATIRKAKLPFFDMSGTHDLGMIWGYVKDGATVLDARYRVHIEGLEEYVRDIADLDATGQVFRYPFDTENNKHLVEVSVINVLVLKQRFEELVERLRHLAVFNDDVLDEYRWGTFTSKLSRAQLVEIARALPPRAQWTGPGFDAAKAAIKQTYGLSSNDFSRAICQIEKRHEIAILIDLELKIPGLSAEALETFFDQWTKIHSLKALRAPPEPLIIGSGEVGLEKMLEWRQKRDDCAAALLGAILPQAFAALDALFYFNREQPYSEAFEAVLQVSLREATAHTDPQRFRSAILNLLDRTSALVNVLNSLDFLGQASLCDLLLARYGLDVVRERLLESSAARKRYVKLVHSVGAAPA